MYLCDFLVIVGCINVRYRSCEMLVCVDIELVLVRCISVLENEKKKMKRKMKEKNKKETQERGKETEASVALHISTGRYHGPVLMWEATLIPGRTTRH